jgi:hypothetical protein
LRHYSTSRTAVLSVALPICVAILGWVLVSPPGGRLAIFLLSAEVIVYSYSVVLSIFFSGKYEQIRKALVKIEAGDEILLYSTVVGIRPRGRWHLDMMDRTLIVASVVLHLAYYTYNFTR